MTNQPQENEISSLIRLIDDEDDFVWSRVREKLISLGEDVLPFLDIAVRDENLVLRRRAIQIINAILPNQIGEKIRKLTVKAKGGDIDLEQGVMILSEYGYPDFDHEGCRKTLDELAEGLRKNIPEYASPDRIVRELTHFLFIDQGFKGDKKNFFDKDNSYFNQVLNQRKGLPISLSVLCILISLRLNLNIVGVGLPCHFVVMHNSPGQPIYFDPFNRGKVLTVQGCKELVNSFGFEFKEMQLAPVSNRDILLRMIHNLEVTFNQSDQQDDAKNMAEFATILTRPHQKKTPNR
jgi:regulator of sirC expression with transglutaminase-like and TPR domain